MELVSPDRIVLIGPGSEWFWAAASFVLVAASVVGIRRQLQAQSAANALMRNEALDDTWNGKALVLARLQTAIDLRDGSWTREVPGRASPFLTFLDTLSDLHEEGHVSLGDIGGRWGRGITIWWHLLGPLIESERRLVEDPTICARFERLALQVIADQRRRGRDFRPFLSIPKAELLNFVIADLEGQLMQIYDAEATSRPDIRPETEQQPGQGFFDSQPAGVPDVAAVDQNPAVTKAEPPTSTI